MSALPLWKTLTLGGYYYASLPYRSAWMRGAARRREAPLMIVFYHRVADTNPNLWTITNRDFAAQVEWLQAHYEMISFEEVQRRMRVGNPRPAVSISFDDGYAENCEHALPLLIRRRIPTTYFVTWNNIVRGGPFPHDAAIGRPAAPNSVEQLAALADAGVEIGCHTRTHPDLGAVHCEQRIDDEVLRVRDELAEAVRRPVRYFAFPYGLHGNLNERVFQLCEEAGFDAVCSAYGGFNFPGDDPFHLQRIHGDPQFLLLKNYLTVDPRKLASVKPYRYTRSPSRPAGDEVRGDEVRGDEVAAGGGGGSRSGCESPPLSSTTPPATAGPRASAIP